MGRRKIYIFNSSLKARVKMKAKPIWRETKITEISRQLYEKYSCIYDCGKKKRCQVVVAMGQEPPNACGAGESEVIRGSDAGQEKD